MPKRILVVEDNDDLRSFYHYALTAAGFDVQEAADGIQALRHLDNHPPDLVVLDLRLPMVSGVDVKEELAANIQTREIPIVVVTGSPQDLRGVAPDCVLTKPVMPEELVRTVQRCLESIR